jgi:hypothetical protein
MDMNLDSLDLAPIALRSVYESTSNLFEPLLNADGADGLSYGDDHDPFASDDSGAIPDEENERRSILANIKHRLSEFDAEDVLRRWA